MKRLICFPSGLIIALTCAYACYAQGAALGIGIAGIVSDKTGAAFPSATVVAENKSGIRQSVTTNGRGEYSLLGLPTGRYTVTVSAPGFEALKANDVWVTAGQPIRLDMSLEPARVTATTTVEAGGPARIETDTAQLSGTITSQELTGLQLNGRNFTQLIALTPGVSNQTGQDEAKVGVQGSASFSVNGGRTEYNSFDLDGSDLLNSGFNGSVNTLIVYPSLDAIQEVKVLTSNYGAMYGRTASGTVLITSKSGTNQFHGDGYYFGRNEAFNARNFFDETKGAPLYRRHDFGGTIGGPLFIPHVYNTHKDKTFFFFSEEVRRENSPFQFNQAVPSAAERRGDFSDVCPPTPLGTASFVRDPSIATPQRPYYPDCPSLTAGSPAGTWQTFPHNSLDQSQSGNSPILDANAVAILATGIIPLPNATSGCNSTIGSCYDVTASPPTHWREELLRADHNFTEKTRLMVRYIHDNWDTITPTPQYGVIQNSFPTVQNNFTGPGLSTIARLTQSISPTLVNEFSFSYANSDITLTDVAAPGVQLSRPDALSQPCEQLKKPGFPNLNYVQQCPLGALFNNGFGGKIPGLVFSGDNRAYGGYGFSVDEGYMPWHHSNPVYTFSDSMTKQLGSHLLQFGSEFIIYRRAQNNSVSGAATGETQGILTFTNFKGGNAGTGNVFANFLVEQITSQNLPQAGGEIQSFQQDSGQLEYRLRYGIAEPYFQDDWKVSSHLTVNLGLRLSLFGRYKLLGSAYDWLPGAFDPSLTKQLGISNMGVLVNAPWNYAGVNVPVPLNLNNLDPRITNGLIKCDQQGPFSSCMISHLANLAPRIGFAWDPLGDGKTAIRGGYGIFYEHGTGNEANVGALEGAAPFVLSETQIRPFDYCAIGGVACTTTPAAPSARPLNVTSIPEKALWPYVQQWSLSVQRALPGQMVATVAYVGSKGTHLTDERQINQLRPVAAADNPFLPGEVINLGNGPAGVGFNPNNPPGDCSHNSVAHPTMSTSFYLLNGKIVSPGSPAYPNLLAVCDEYNSLATASLTSIYPDTVRPYLGLGEIVSLENSANSSYNALQLTLRRTQGPLTLGLSYTYSHSLDDSSDRFEPTINAYDLRSNWANSNFDQRHLLNISYIYQLPGLAKSNSLLRTALNGWQWSGITLYASGTPFSVYNAANGVLDNAGVLNGIGSGPALVQSYPNLVGNPNTPPPPGSNNGFSIGPALLNPAAFAAPQALTLGNAGRDRFNNPSRLNFDMALEKNFHVREGQTLEFRAEAFNVFNHTQFEIFNRSLGNRGNNVVTCYGPASSGSSAGDASCLAGSSFLHPVDAHRPRTLQLGLKFVF